MRRVALMKWTGPETVAKAVEAVDAWKAFKPGMNVLLKPNAVMAGSAKMPPRGITTDPHIALFAGLEGRSTELADVEVIGENPADHQLTLQYSSHWLDDLMERYKVSGMHMPPYGLRLCSACGFNLWVGLMGFCKSQQGKSLEKSEVLAGNDTRPSVDGGRTVMLGKCAIKANKTVKDAIRVPGCPPDPAKVVEIMTKALKPEIDFFHYF